MKLERILLLIDAAINLVLGAGLIISPRGVVAALGAPVAAAAFYPSILGAVFFGIGIALLIGRARGGLGLAGAVAINLCGGSILGLWLVFGDLWLPGRGLVFLWGLVAVLLGISALELLASRRRPASEFKGKQDRA